MINDAYDTLRAQLAQLTAHATATTTTSTKINDKKQPANRFEMARFIYWLRIECRRNANKWRKKKYGKNTFIDDTQWQRSNSANVAKTQLKINIYDFQIILMINFDSRKNYLFKPFTCKTNASNIILRENICVWQPLTRSFTHREELIDSKSQGNRKGIFLPLLKRLICFART